MSTPSECNVPNGGPDSADDFDFVETPKEHIKIEVEAETRPDFEELKKSTSSECNVPNRGVDSADDFVENPTKLVKVEAEAETRPDFEELKKITAECDIPNGGADSVDYFIDIEAPKKLVKVEAETRPDFEELKKIEKKRREILLRAELPFWRIIMFWSGTCLKEIATDSLVWATIIIYVGIRIFANSIDYVPESVQMLSKTNIGILGGFLSFFLVLFVNQTNGRFLEMYGFSKACSGRIQDVAGLAKTQLPSEVGEKLVRHFNAAHIAGYVGLNAIGMGSPYSKTFFFDHYNAESALLTPRELTVLGHHDMDNSGLCMKELVTWCQMDVAQARKDGHIDSYQEKYMHDKILAFRAAMDGMYDYTDQPPHFFYIHFLVLLSALYLPLFAIDTAYAGGWGAEKSLGLDLLQGIIVFLQCIFVVGLRSLGTKMIDPYGDDLEDLSVINYVEGTLEICRTIMGAKQAAKGASGGTTTTGLL